MTKHAPYIWHDNAWHKVKPIMVKITNMGPIPSNALITSTGVPFLTNSKEYFLVDPDTEGLTAETSTDYLLYETLGHTAYI